MTNIQPNTNLKLGLKTIDTYRKNSEVFIMTYEGKCPHCGNVVRGGHGTPMKRIDTPVRTCFRCGHNYVDENMYEWAVLDPVYKFWFIFAANNRGIVLLFSLLLGGVCLAVENIATGIGFLVFSAIWMTLSYIYVKHVHKDAMIASQNRCNAPEYIELLNTIKYDKLANKFNNFYRNYRK